MAARIRVQSPGDVASVAAELRRDPAVATVEPDGLVFGDAGRVPIRAANDRFYGTGLALRHDRSAGGVGHHDRVLGRARRSGGRRIGRTPYITANSPDGYDFVSNDFTACSGDRVPRAGDGDGYDPDPTVPAICDGGADWIGGHGLHVAGTIGAVGNEASAPPG